MKFGKIDAGFAAWCEAVGASGRGIFGRRFDFAAVFSIAVFVFKSLGTGFTGRPVHFRKIDTGFAAQNSVFVTSAACRRFAAVGGNAVSIDIAFSTGVT